MIRRVSPFLLCYILCIYAPEFVNLTAVKYHGGRNYKIHLQTNDRRNIHTHIYYHPIPTQKTTHTLANTHAFPPDAVFRLPLPLRLKPIAAILSRFAAHARLRSIPPNGGCGVRFASRPSDGVLRPAPFRLPPVRTYIELPGAHPPGGSAKRAHAGKPSCAPWVALFTFRPPGQNYMRSMVQPGEPHDTA